MSIKLNYKRQCESYLKFSPAASSDEQSIKQRAWRSNYNNTVQNNMKRQCVCEILSHSRLSDDRYGNLNLSFIIISLILL